MPTSPEYPITFYFPVNKLGFRRVPAARPEFLPGRICVETGMHLKLLPIQAFFFSRTSLQADTRLVFLRFVMLSYTVTDNPAFQLLPCI